MNDKSGKNLPANERLRKVLDLCEAELKIIAENLSYTQFRLRGLQEYIRQRREVERELEG
ncbi:hypothetical protein SAMN05444161_3879 [Rhizobiales bacterium GAS191]|nr:hypothetical protein SAMN05444161_3879 [Rhizobiales bacterium GAS191]